MIRLGYVIIILALIPILPWWILLVLGAAGLVYFHRFWEMVAVFFLYDLAFGLPGGGWLGTQFSLTIVFILVFILVEAYKENLRI